MTEDAKNDVSDWATQHASGLNVSKTSAIIFGSATNLSYLFSLSLPPVLTDNKPVKFVNQLKSLGVILAFDLSWNAYISSVSSKVHGVLHKLTT